MNYGKYIIDGMARHRKPLAYLMQQVEAQQNKEAAREIVITGWPLEKEGYTEQARRDRILHWMVSQANTGKEVQMMSHRTREDMLSYMSIITFKSKWAKGKFQGWWRKTLTTRSPAHYWDQNDQTWDKYTLRQRMQIGNISRTKGIPLKVCMEALSTHHQSTFHRDVSKLSIKWKDRAILGGLDAMAYIDFDEVEAIGTIIIRSDLFE